jgi:hypothetical protein
MLRQIPSPPTALMLSAPQTSPLSHPYKSKSMNGTMKGIFAPTDHAHA